MNSSVISDTLICRSQESSPLTPCALWPVDLKLTHLDWNAEATLIHFQGQYLTICELDYNILQGEIQNVPKNKAAVKIGEFCLVEDSTLARWFRGRVQNQKDDLFDVFLIDCGNILSVDVAHMSSCSSDLLNLPPKIVCGFLANVLLLQNVSHSAVEKYFSSLIGKNVTGFIQALLPHKVLLLEAPDINCDLVQHGFGRPVDTDTFIFLVSMLTDVPLKQNIEPVPDLLIEKPIVQGFCFRSSSLQGYADVLSFCGPRLTCETRTKVRVTAGVNPGLFFCQMVSVEAELQEMSKRLAAIFEHRTDEYNQKTPENLGLLCAVKGKDEKWVRGFVRFLPVNSQVRVFLIDYGLFELVKVENVHRLPPEFYSAPVMALPCTLPSATGQDVALKAQQLSFLKAGLLGTVLDVEIRDFDVEQYLYTITVLGAEETHVEEPEPVQHGPFAPDVKETSSPSGFSNFKTMLSEAFYETLQAEEVQVGSVFVGYVEHAQNPNHFWIRTQKRNEEFEEMMSEITKHFSEVKLDEDLLLNPELGVMCCAVYEEDLHFYRGVVTDILKHGAEIFFIDFGNTEKVPYDLIKNIPETVANKSAFAMCCTLANVFPLDDVWASTTCDFFRKSVLDKALLVRVVRMKKHKCVVELFEMGNDNSITELLIASKLAEYIPVERAARNSKDGTEKTRRLHHPVTADIGGRSEQWENYREEEKTFRNEAEKVKCSFRAVSIKPGFEFSVRCSDISSPSDFWCQPLDKLPALDKLMDDMQHYYSLHTVPLQPGESCCVAKSPHDGKWYRGFVVGKQKGHTSVMLADFGPVIQVKQNHLWAIIPDYTYLEGQAIRCSLYNLFEPAEHTQSGDWSPEVLNLLKNFVLKSANNLRCQVVSQVNVKNKGLRNVVDLYNSQTQQTVTDALREQGLARRATVPMRQRSDVVPDSFVYSSFGVGPGSEEQVYVAHVGSQCEIYCHLERNTEIIEELQMKISEESERMMKANTRAAVGNLCLAKYLDGKWYRGLMLPVPSLLHFDVFFVDYGNTKISEKTKVMFIPRNCEDLLYTPMQALRCRLDSVPEEELYVDAKKWLNDTVLNKCVRAVVRAKREDGSFDIELFDGDMNINKKVKKLILSQSQKPKTASLIKNKHKVKNTTFHKRFTKTRDKCKSPSKGQASASTSNSHRVKNTKNVHWRLHNKSTSVKQQNVLNRRRSPQTESKVKPAEHQTVKSKKPQQSKETKMSQLLCFSEKSIRPGFRTKCFVSHVDSISSFFLQLSDDEPDILKMGEDLNLGVFRDSLKLAESFQVGDVVLAEFEDDGALYRSVIKTQESNSSFKVEFVDYGNSADVWREKMYPLPEDYLSQPRFSIPCSLLDSSLYETDSSFTDAVVERPIMVDFVRQSGIQWQVKMEVLDDATPESSLTENKASLLSIVKSSEEAPSCEQNITDEGQQNEVPKKTSTGGGEDSMPVELSVNQKVKTVKCWRRGRIRRSHKKTKLSSAKVKKDASLPPTIEPGDTDNGTVLSVQRDGFYIRLSKNKGLLKALEEQIKNNMNQFKTVGEANVKRGLRCLVQVQEDTFGRAVVQQVNEGEFKVFLVDYGVTKDIPSVPVLEQCTDLMEFPNLAVLCRMKSSGFTEEKEANQGWYETLEPMIGSEVKLIFVSFSEADDSWMVEIVMNELFLLWQIKASRRQIDDRSASPADTQSEGGPTSDTSAPQQLVFAAVDNDKVYSGSAAGVATPSDFCVVLEDLLLTRNKVSAILDELPLEMPPLPEAHLVPGTCCLLKPESRNRWCRAEIIHADATVVLDLVDHGHYECISSHDLSKLKKLPVELTDLPKLTYPCTLKGVKPAGGDGQWSDEAAVFFQKCLDQKNLQIFFREFVSNSDWNVDIVVDGVHVAKKLVDTGHANYMDVAPELRFQATGPSGPGSEEEEGSPDGSEEEEGSPDGKQTFNAESRSNHCFLM
ncbi:tudor domain-containing protein 15 [Nematolebias whitei]|uniref:tudor domain-containing protein 15 n=1 Tax=Nematolebias whitei TaxID=451745 RepID=UPI0018988731|nr:tudor domain-containing protein 15 [Nematolebias whitei]